MEDTIMKKYCNHCMAQLSEDEVTCQICGKENSTTVPAHHLLPGTVLNDKFYVGEALGEGGFGITYIGRDIKLDMKVAIKEFYPNGYVNRSNTIATQVNSSITEGRRAFFEKGRDRFLKEAQILAKFSGEQGVVDVRDFFEENNTAYIIMEYLDGVDLKTYLKRNGTLTPEQTIQLLMPVMNSLKKIHAQGLIHRDISPDNIMIVGDKVKLLDFGAARNVSAAANKSLSVMLKPGYAPEEQYRSKGNQGPWTDVYALCATMYKCITGITPDDATQRVFSDEVKNPSALGITISTEVESAIMRGMSVQQNDRYQNIEDLLRGIQGIDVALSGAECTVATSHKVEEDDRETQYVQHSSNTDKTILDTEKNVAVTIGFDKITAVEENIEQSVDKKTTTVDNAKKILIVLLALMMVVIIILIVVLAIPKKYSDKDDMSGKLDTPTPSRETSAVPTEMTSEQSIEPTFMPTRVPTNVPTNVPTIEPTSVPTNEPALTDKEIVMSDDLFDFTFKLEGVVYQLPCRYDEFTKNGWTISSSGYNSETLLAGNSHGSFQMSRDGCRITITSYNMSGNAKAIKDCKVGGIECSGYENVSFSIAKGITVSASAEEVKDAFGVPANISSGSGYETLTYYVSNNSYNNTVRFWCDNDESSSSILLKNFIEGDDDKTVTNTKRPEYLDSYIQPTSRGEHLVSSVIELEGDLYQLPAPVSSFIDNGWKIIQKSGDVASGNSSSIRIEKDGQKLDLYVINYAEYQTNVENCAVYEVYIRDSKEPALSLGSENAPVHIGTTKAELDSLITGEFSCYEYTDSYSYSYYEYKGRNFDLYINVDKETELVTYISISCDSWDY